LARLAREPVEARVQRLSASKIALGGGLLKPLQSLLDIAEPNVYPRNIGPWRRIEMQQLLQETIGLGRIAFDGERMRQT
jgi:hypothetical protein